MGQNVSVFVFESAKVIATVPKSLNGGDNGKDRMNITPMTKELQTLVERKLNYINNRNNVSSATSTLCSSPTLAQHRLSGAPTTQATISGRKS